VSKAAQALTRLVKRISLLNEFVRTLAAVLFASFVVSVLPPETDFDTTTAVYWDVWAATYLGLTWTLIIRSSPEETRRWALAQRPVDRAELSLLRWMVLRALQVLFLVGRTSSLLFIVLVSLLGLFAAISLLPQVRDLETTHGVLAAVLNALGVIAAWAVLHTSFALYYAYRYYRSGESPGLEFPGEQDPSQLDFAYFAFTIGISLAVSDVQVTDPAIRRSVLGHQILSFFYNTAILALVIDLAAGS
jgi:uncharacterized membrane protein